MEAPDTHGPVTRLTSADAPQVVDVFTDAFRDYPVMRYVIGEAGDAYEDRLRRLIGFFVQARVLREEPLFGVVTGGSLVAAATVSFPGRGDVPPDFEAVREAAWRELGEDARSRYEACGRAWSSLEVVEPHTHLNMIGVRRAAQGTGLAARLLEQVHELSRALAWSTGVTLTTEDPRNVPFYRKAGYEVVGRADVAPGLETWGFFRRE